MCNSFDENLGDYKIEGIWCPATGNILDEGYCDKDCVRCSYMNQYKNDCPFCSSNNKEANDG